MSETTSASPRPGTGTGGAPRVVASIVHWNGGEGTLACIESLLAENYADLDIVLVDNASTDDIADRVAARWPAIHVVRLSCNTGFTGGHNCGIDYARARHAAYVMLLNQDARLVEGCLHAMVALAEADERTGLVSPLIHVLDDPARLQFGGSWLQPDSLTIAYSSDVAVLRERDRDAATTMCLWGTALLIRRTVIDEIGKLDERLFAYYEDTDLSVRAAAAGWRNRICFDASILHEAHRTRLSRGPHFFYYMARNELLFWRGVMSRRPLRATRVCLARGMIIAAKLRDEGHAGQVDACILGMVDALRGRTGGYRPDRLPPRWLKRVLLWHPYLLGRMLGFGYPIF